MNPINETNNSVMPLIVAAAVITVIILLAGITRFAAEFLEELRYLKIEIDRTEGSERKYWKRRRRRLWLSWLLFIKY